MFPSAEVMEVKLDEGMGATDFQSNDIRSIDFKPNDAMSVGP